MFATAGSDSCEDSPSKVHLRGIWTVYCGSLLQRFIRLPPGCHLRQQTTRYKIMGNETSTSNETYAETNARMDRLLAYKKELDDKFEAEYGDAAWARRCAARELAKKKKLESMPREVRTNPEWISLYASLKQETLGMGVQDRVERYKKLYDHLMDRRDEVVQDAIDCEREGDHYRAASFRMIETYNTDACRILLDDMDEMKRSIVVVDVSNEGVQYTRAQCEMRRAELHEQRTAIKAKEQWVIKNIPSTVEQYDRELDKLVAQREKVNEEDGVLEKRLTVLDLDLVKTTEDLRPVALPRITQKPIPLVVAEPEVVRPRIEFVEPTIDVKRKDLEARARLLIHEQNIAMKKLQKQQTLERQRMLDLAPKEDQSVLVASFIEKKIELEDAESSSDESVGDQMGEDDPLGVDNEMVTDTIAKGPSEDQRAPVTVLDQMVDKIAVWEEQVVRLTDSVDQCGNGPGIYERARMISRLEAGCKRVDEPIDFDSVDKVVSDQEYSLTKDQLKSVMATGEYAQALVKAGGAERLIQQIITLETLRGLPPGVGRIDEIQQAVKSLVIAMIEDAGASGSPELSVGDLEKILQGLPAVYLLKYSGAKRVRGSTCYILRVDCARRTIVYDMKVSDKSSLLTSCMGSCPLLRDIGISDKQIREAERENSALYERRKRIEKWETGGGVDLIEEQGVQPVVDAALERRDVQHSVQENILRLVDVNNESSPGSHYLEMRMVEHWRAMESLRDGRRSRGPTGGVVRLTGVKNEGNTWLGSGSVVDRNYRALQTYARMRNIPITSAWDRCGFVHGYEDQTDDWCGGGSWVMPDVPVWQFVAPDPLDDLDGYSSDSQQDFRLKPSFKAEIEADIPLVGTECRGVTKPTFRNISDWLRVDSKHDDRIYREQIDTEAKAKLNIGPIYLDECHNESDSGAAIPGSSTSGTAQVPGDDTINLQITTADGPQIISGLNLGSGFDPTAVSVEDQAPAEMVNRKIFVGNVQWGTASTGGTRLATYNLPHVLMQGTSAIANVFQYYSYLNMGVRFTIKLSGGDFHAGHLVCVYMPGASNTTDEKALFNMPLGQIVSYPHVPIMASESTTVVVDCPYDSSYNYLPAKGFSTFVYGHLDIYVLGPLSAPTGATQIVNLTIYAEPLEPDMRLKRPPSAVTIGPRFSTMRLTNRVKTVGKSVRVEEVHNEMGGKFYGPGPSKSNAVARPLGKGGKKSRQVPQQRRQVYKTQRKQPQQQQPRVVERVIYRDRPVPSAAPAPAVAVPATPAAPAATNSSESSGGFFDGLWSTIKSVVPLVSTIAGFLDKPDTDASAPAVIEHFGQSSASGCGTSTSRTLSLLQGLQRVALDDEIGEVGTFEDIVKMPGYVFQGGWGTGSAAGDPVFTLDVSPILPNLVNFGKTYNTNNTGYSVNLTPLAAATIPWQYWRGSLDFIFDVDCNRFWNGSLTVVWFPMTNSLGVTALGSLSAATESTSRTAMFEVQGPTQFVFNVPFAHTTPAKEVLDIVHQTKSVFNASGLSPFVGNGAIGLYVRTPAVAQAGSPTAVSIHVWVRAGDDYEVAIPSPNWLSYITGVVRNYDQSGATEQEGLVNPNGTILPRPYAYERNGNIGEDDEEDFIKIRDCHNEMSGIDDLPADLKPKTAAELEMTIPVPMAPAVKETILDHYFGEPNDIYSMMKRYQQLFAISTGQTANLTSYMLVIPVSPCMSAAEWVIGTAPTANLFQRETYLSWYSRLFRKWRGSLRYRFEIGTAGNMGRHRCFFIPFQEQPGGWKSFITNGQGLNASLFAVEESLQNNAYPTATSNWTGNYQNSGTNRSQLWHAGSMFGEVTERTDRALEVTVPFFDNHRHELTTNARHGFSGVAAQSYPMVPQSTMTGMLIYTIDGPFAAGGLFYDLKVMISAGDDFVYAQPIGGATAYVQNWNAQT